MAAGPVRKLTYYQVFMQDRINYAQMTASVSAMSIQVENAAAQCNVALTMSENGLYVPASVFPPPPPPLQGAGSPDGNMIAPDEGAGSPDGNMIALDEGAGSPDGNMIAPDEGAGSHDQANLRRIIPEANDDEFVRGVWAGCHNGHEQTVVSLQGVNVITTVPAPVLDNEEETQPLVLGVDFGDSVHDLMNFGEDNAFADLPFYHESSGFLAQGQATVAIPHDAAVHDAPGSDSLALAGGCVSQNQPTIAISNDAAVQSAPASDSLALADESTGHNQATSTVTYENVTNNADTNSATTSVTTVSASACLDRPKKYQFLQNKLFRAEAGSKQFNVSITGNNAVRFSPY